MSIDEGSSSLLDRIKKAMGTYASSMRLEPIRSVIYRVADGVEMAAYTMASQARAHTLDLNALVVMDAIAGSVKWKNEACWFGSANVGEVWYHNGVWLAKIRDNHSKHASKDEARYAVEDAFRQSLVQEKSCGTN